MVPTVGGRGIEMQPLRELSDRPQFRVLVIALLSVVLIAIALRAW